MNEKYFFLYIQIIFALIAIVAPLLQPKNLLFGIRLSKGLQQQPEISQFKKNYLRKAIRYFGIWLLVVNYLIFKKNQFNTNYIWGEVIIMFGLYILTNNQLRQWKAKMYREKPELKPENPTVYIDTNFRNENLTISNKLNFIPAVIILGQLFINFRYLDVILAKPELMQNITKYFVMNFVLLFMVFWKNFLIKNAKQQIQASNPEESKQQIIIFRRRWSLFLFIMLTGIIIMNFLFNLQILRVIPEMRFISEDTYLIFSVLIVTISVLLSIFLGQAGSKIKLQNTAKESTHDDIDDDTHWKLGMIYYNPNDPSLWVDKRMGVGWTLNFGNRWSWVFIVAIFTFAIIASIFNL